MNLNDVNRGIKKFKARRRIGRGIGSGHGKTSGRGHKGQGSRAGFSMKPTFEGGQMPLVRRTPKRGFNNRWAKTVVSINVGQLNDLFESGEEVTAESIQARGRLKCRFDELKILGNGDLTKKLKIAAHRFSKTAEEKIQQSGSEMVVVPGKVTVAEKREKRGKKEAK
jgi:large subunit ribosomal protein L15